MSDYKQSIDFLNQATGQEISASMQYMYFHVHCEDAGYEYLSRLFHRVAIQEMKHIEEFSERILFLDGDVNMNQAFKVVQIREVKDMLKKAIQLERETIDTYNSWARICGQNEDAATKKMFEDTIVEEEQHIDTFQRELDNLEKYGDQYLALQAVAGSKHESKVVGSD